MMASSPLSLLFWLLVPFGCGLCEIFSYDDWYMELGDERVMESPGYPNPTPVGTRHVWTVRAETRAVLLVKCDDFRLGEEPCGEDGLNLEEGGRRQNACGHRTGFQYWTGYNSLYASLTAKRTDANYLRCTIRAVNRKLMPNYNASETDSYLDYSSEEVDSSEHGGARGPKTTTCRCGTANKELARIFFGKETKINEYPFMAAVVQTKWPKGAFCGASIITAYHAMTAAHCTANSTKGISIVVGEHDLESTVETTATEIVNVKQVVTHPGYSGRPNQYNDIAILVLEKKLNFNLYVSPVCLPTGQLRLDNLYVTVMGWGATEAADGYESVLKYIHVRVMSKPACHEARAPWVPEGSPNQLCVYGRKRSACYGDSGGPVLWVDPETNRYTVIGINSYGVTECATEKPIVITDVTTYLDWIHRVISETNPDGVTCTKEN
uniref:Venom S1 protease with CUB domain 4 n=1 Tax=Lethocerus distinctifemur TaxID=280095 RepID=A0A2K8JLD2_9HEMI|nr:venom S1 protease with CUB domain 4 [Lethocerus distinctifemur]